jgi:hypothetical protein
MSARRVLAKVMAIALAAFVTPQLFPEPASAVPMGPPVLLPYTGLPIEYTVPDGTTRLTVVVAGGSGAAGQLTTVTGALQMPYTGPPWQPDTSKYQTGTGGAGGLVRAVIVVTPGQKLTIKVGGMGVLDAGGWPDGGRAGLGTTGGGWITDPSGTKCCGGGTDGGGGGGSSSIWSGSTPLVVAAGGGGGGGGGNLDDRCQGYFPPLVWHYNPLSQSPYPPCGGTWTLAGSGGDGGFDPTGNGEPGMCGTWCSAGQAGGQGGGGGTSSSGGAGGAGSQSPSGTSGGFASGGTGATADAVNTGAGGGGGGGGYYGGGGGGSDWYQVCACDYYPFGPTGGGGGGGGGGSSYVTPASESRSLSSGAQGAGFVQITPTAVGGHCPPVC